MRQRDRAQATLQIPVVYASGTGQLILERRAQDWLARNAPAIRSEGSGPSMMFSHIGRRNIQSMLIGTTAALVLISLLLTFALRSRASDRRNRTTPSCVILL